jgi:hypothetical protein
MGFFDRLLGKRRRDAGGEKQTPLSLQLLFSRALRLNINTLTHTLQGLAPSLAQVHVELEALGSKELGAEVGTVRWERHAVQVVVFNKPMPAEVVERCVAPAHYGPELKAQARAHGAHALLYYRGAEEDALEQYVALGLVAVALASEEALVVLNESAYASFPLQPLVPEPGEEVLELLRTLPLTALYVGFVKLEVAGSKGVWMRTYGGPRMGLPDLACHARSHEEGREIFELFSGLLEYLRSSRERFAEGHTAEWEERQVRLRKPRSGEEFLVEEGELFVLEPR